MTRMTVGTRLAGGALALLGALVVGAPRADTGRVSSGEGTPSLLSLERRAAAMAAVERVRYLARGGDPEAFERLYPAEAWRARATDVTAKSRCLLERFGVAIDDQALEHELDRILSSSLDRERLNRMLAVLDHDRTLAKECLVRPSLVQRRLWAEVARDPEIQATARREADRLAAADDALELEQAAGPLAVRSSLRAMAGGASPGQARSEWEPADETKLERIRARFEAGQPAIQLEEDDRAFVVSALVAASPEAVELVRATVPKRTADEWWDEASWQFAAVMPPQLVAAWGSGGGRVRVPFLATSEDGGADSSGERWWIPRHAPPARRGHSAVWTGSEMIIWGGSGPIGDGWRYDPVLDSWAPISADGEPEPRVDHTAVWTGTEMVVWGGGLKPRASAGSYYNAPYLRTGGRYDPVLDRWRPTSTVGAPAGLVGHSAVWTGTEMIVWGGSTGDQFPWKGKRYDPVTDTWTSMPYLGDAPLPRADHSCVWTGTEMIVWGGIGEAGYLDDGGAYNPSTNSWRQIEHYGAPAKRLRHTAVWTGTEMVVVGGKPERMWTVLGSGGRYDPVTDRWASIASAPVAGARSVWTGSELITWGAPVWTSPSNRGSRYDPRTDTWRQLPSTGAPSARGDFSMVWTGRELIVWGGEGGPKLDTGGIYRPETDSWRPTSTGGTPGSRLNHTAVWTGQEMVVWGGYLDRFMSDGWSYELATDTWLPLPARHECSPREYHTAVWTGRELLIWGGMGIDGPSGSGCAWDAGADRWRPLSNAGSPSPRWWHSSVWTGSEMIVWGGSLRWPSSNALYTASGARYRPGTDAWSDLPAAPESQGRGGHLALWTGTEMLVWGGYNGSFPHVGGVVWREDLGSWRAMTVRGGPDPLYTTDRGVWTGGEMLLWGGRLWADGSLEGARYDPAGDRWSRLTAVGAPNGPRVGHAELWAGREMIVWGGDTGDDDRSADGGRFSPATGIWSDVTERGAPPAMFDATTVWTGREMILWGGDAAPGLAVYRPPAPPVRRAPPGGRLGPG